MHAFPLQSGTIQGSPRNKKITQVFLIDKRLEQALKERKYGDFPGGAVVKNLPASAGDTGSIPGPGRSHMPRSN